MAQQGSGRRALTPASVYTGVLQMQGQFLPHRPLPAQDRASTALCSGILDVFTGTLINQHLGEQAYIEVVPTFALVEMLGF